MSDRTVTVNLDDLLLLLRRVEPLLRAEPGDILVPTWQSNDPVIDAIDRMGDRVLVARQKSGEFK